MPVIKKMKAHAVWVFSFVSILFFGYIHRAMRWKWLLVPMICWMGVAHATPTEMHLLFDDRTLTLDFELQPELLKKTPQHFWTIGGIELPIDIGDQLTTGGPLSNVVTRFEANINAEALREYFDASALLREQNEQIVELRFDEKNEILIEGEPRDGYDIDFEKLVQLIDRAIRAKKSHVRVPSKKTYSRVIAHPDLENNGIQEILAIGESNFSGSSNARRQNIIAGANRFQHILIRQGESFSFNTLLHSVDEEYGFVPELVIKGDDTKKELGGGLCQVSTTAFRAAFNAGLPILDRRNHSYAVPYYKPFGLDATIYLGGQDFTFHNNTPGDILIQTIVDEDDLRFVLYGTSDNRTIRFEGPFISNVKPAPDPQFIDTDELPDGIEREYSPPHEGFRSEWVRVVQQGSLKEIKSFVSWYRPWPAKILRGTGEN